MRQSRLKKVVVLFAVTASALSGLLFGLVTIEESGSRHHLEAFLANVNVDDGISEREADGMAWAYFQGFVGACGGPERAMLVDGDWVIPAEYGYGATPMESPIRINAKTGAISQVGGPRLVATAAFESAYCGESQSENWHCASRLITTTSEPNNDS